MSSEWIVPPGLGMVVILSGPSGVGKTTVSLRLLDLGLALRRVVTTTTRAARPGEVCGVDYHFFSDPEFDQALAQGEFLESAMVHGKRYGTRLSSLCEAAQGGYGVLLVSLLEVPLFFNVEMFDEAIPTKATKKPRKTKP